MKKIVITSDSGMDPLDEENMIPAIVIKDKKEEYKDIFEINSHEILEQTKLGSVFQTTAPCIEDYRKKFVEHLEKGEDVIHLSMSSGISEGSVNTAHFVAEELKKDYENKVYVIDSFTGATGGTLLLELAKDFVRKTKNKEELIKELQKLKRRIQTSFYVPNPEGFIRSGRNKSELCFKEKALLVSAKVFKLTSVKFRVDFNQEGNLYTKALMRCKTGSGMRKLAEEIISKDNMEDYDPTYAVIGTLEEEKTSMDDIKEYLESLHYFKKIIRKDINGVVAAYGSPDLGGISLVKKKKGIL